MDPLLIVGQFNVPAASAAVLHGSGLIHDTYVVSCAGGGRYILQRINSQVFRNVPAVQENIQRVTDHLRRKVAAEGGDPAREVLALIPTTEGKSFCRTGAGREFWRMYRFIEGARTYDAATPAQAYEAARAFGRFQRLLADLPDPLLHETIAGFHHTPSRFEAFMRAAQTDAAGRAAAAAAEIDFALARHDIVAVLEDLAAAGSLPRRAVHNDTKLNNVLIDDATGKGLCVIDLDTVMPGLSVIDFGDCCRTAAATTAEDDPDTSRMRVNLEMFTALARGYLSEARTFLTADEIEHLPLAARLITFEQGLRFLTDWLAGDVYYKTARPAHNLDRTRAQFKLVQEFEAAHETMTSIIRQCLQD
ncbi:MAG: aminoglycoside phosphotransferase family protein [Planctomycetaceae bacterium]|nr:aminoglycoside phosphotransferase family protein [Planctomycetaceae bacterium]